MTLDPKTTVLSIHHILIIDVGLTTSNDQQLPGDALQLYPSFDQLAMLHKSTTTISNAFLKSNNNNHYEMSTT